MTFDFKYKGFAESSKNGQKVEYATEASGHATDIGIEKRLAEGVADASAGALDAAISIVATKKYKIDADID